MAPEGGLGTFWGGADAFFFRAVTTGASVALTGTPFVTMRHGFKIAIAKSAVNNNMREPVQKANRMSATLRVTVMIVLYKK
jgi:hypothetical protein